MSETIKAKTSQRLRRRLGCHLRVSLTSRRNTIVPLLSLLLLLLLKILADASYPSLLPLNLFYRNFEKKNKKRHPKALYVHPTEPWPFLLLVHPTHPRVHGTHQAYALPPGFLSRPKQGAPFVTHSYGQRRPRRRERTCAKPSM